MKHTYSLFILFISVFFCDHSNAESITVSGSVSGVWDVDTVKVVSDVEIREDEGLIIQPGVLVEFEGSHSLIVRGYLHAPGTENDPVIFDVSDTTGFSIDTIPGGGWKGIQYYYCLSPDSSIFEHCTFRHGKAVGTDTLENHGGAISARYSGNIRISFCRFENNFASLNGGAVYLKESSVAITNCEFINNSCGPVTEPWGYGGAICSDHSDVSVFKSFFEGNSSTGVGGAIAVRFRDAKVHNSIFTGNHSGLGGAIGYLHYYEFPYSQCNNLIYGNTSEFFGGGIASIDAGPVFVNNTITGNTSVYGGGFYVKDSIVPVVYNSILWNNIAGVGSQVYLWDAYASADFYHCDIEGGAEAFGGSGGGAGYSGNYNENLDLDPLFEGPSVDDYHLSLGSPLQNEGTPDTTGLGLPATDLDGSPRIDIHALVVDIGCYEVQWVGVGPDSPENGPEFEVIRNRLYYNGAELIKSVRIYDLSGRTVQIDQEVDMSQGITLNGLGEGIYISVFFTGSGAFSGKIYVTK